MLFARICARLGHRLLLSWSHQFTELSRFRRLQKVERNITDGSTAFAQNHEYTGRDAQTRALEAYRAKELLRPREFAYARSAFYQRFHKGLFEHPLHELPVPAKATVMENFDQLVTDRAIHLDDVRAHMANDREGNRFLKRYWVTATSGSTGIPGVFLFNRDECVIVAAFMKGPPVLDISKEKINLLLLQPVRWLQETCRRGPLRNFGPTAAYLAQASRAWCIWSYFARLISPRA